jgi:hypothetical protein
LQQITKMGAKSPTARAEALAAADLKARRQEYLWAAPEWLGASSKMAGRLLEDARDAPAMWLVLNVACLALPAAVALHAHPAPPHWVGAAYLVLNYALFLQVELQQRQLDELHGVGRVKQRLLCRAQARDKA